MTRDEAVAERERQRTNSEFIWITAMRPNLETAVKRGLIDVDKLLYWLDYHHDQMMEILRMYHEEEIKRLYPEVS